MSIISSSFRSISKRWVLTSLNILGYGVGIAACLLIIHNIIYETSFDEFNEKKDRLVRVNMDHYYSDVYQNSTAISQYLLGEEMKNQYPEVEEFARVQRVPRGAVRYEDKNFLEKYIYTTDSAYFKMFDVELISGGTKNLNSLDLFISETFAKKYFGDEDPTLKLMTVMGRSCQVRGVYKDIPKNTHLYHEMLVIRPNWNGRNMKGYAYHTYLLLKPGTDIDRFEKNLEPFNKELSAFFDERSAVEYRFDLDLIKVSDIHLKSKVDYEHRVNGDLINIYILVIVCAFILIISSFNYINLTNSMNAERVGDIFIRKLHGASRFSVLRQYATESIMLNLFGFILSIVIVVLVTTHVDFFANSSNFIIDWTNPTYYAFLAIILLISFMFSGLIPALIFSSFNPLRYLNGEYTRSDKAKSFGKLLSVAQFAISFILISGAFTINKQLSFMNNHELGFEKDDVIGINTPQMPYERMKESISQFKTSLVSNSAIRDVAFSEYIPGTKHFRDVSVRLSNKTVDEAKFSYAMVTTSPFLDVYNIELKAGRMFDDKRVADSLNVVVNETLAKELVGENYEDVLSKDVTISWRGDYRTFNVVGVVSNYHHETVKSEFRPLIFVPIKNGGVSLNISILTNGINNEVATLIEDEYRKSFTGRALDMFNVEDHYNKQMEADIQFAGLVELFALLAILMSGIGFLGLASNETRKRVREVAIRKVNGARIIDITVWFVFRFMRLIGLAIIISIPISFYLADDWLSNFSNRVSIGLWFFIWPVLITTVISLLSMGHHILKVATMNPVHILRNND